MSVFAESKVSFLRYMVANKHSVPPAAVRLLHAGRELRDDETVASAGLHHATLVHAVFLNDRAGFDTRTDASDDQVEAKYDNDDHVEAEKDKGADKVADKDLEQGAYCDWDEQAVSLASSLASSSAVSLASSSASLSASSLASLSASLSASSLASSSAPVTSTEAEGLQEPVQAEAQGVSSHRACVFVNFRCFELLLFLQMDFGVGSEVRLDRVRPLDRAVVCTTLDALSGLVLCEPDPAVQVRAIECVACVLQSDDLHDVGPDGVVAKAVNLLHKLVVRLACARVVRAFGWTAAEHVSRALLHVLPDGSKYFASSLILPRPSTTWVTRALITLAYLYDAYHVLPSCAATLPTPSGRESKPAASQAFTVCVTVSLQLTSLNDRAACSKLLCALSKTTRVGAYSLVHAGGMRAARHLLMPPVSGMCEHADNANSEGPVELSIWRHVARAVLCMAFNVDDDAEIAAEMLSFNGILAHAVNQFDVSTIPDPLRTRYASVRARCLAAYRTSLRPSLACAAKEACEGADQRAYEGADQRACEGADQRACEGADKDAVRSQEALAQTKDMVTQMQDALKTTQDALETTQDALETTQGELETTQGELETANKELGPKTEDFDTAANVLRCEIRDSRVEQSMHRQNMDILTKSNLCIRNHMLAEIRRLEEETRGLSRSTNKQAVELALTDEALWHSRRDVGRANARCAATRAQLYAADAQHSALQREFESLQAAKDAEMAGALAAKDAEMAGALAAKDAEIAGALAAKDAESAGALAAKDAEIAGALAAKDADIAGALAAKDAEIAAKVADAVDMRKTKDSELSATNAALFCAMQGLYVMQGDRLYHAVLNEIPKSDSKAELETYKSRAAAAESELEQLKRRVLDVLQNSF